MANHCLLIAYRKSLIHNPYLLGFALRWLNETFTSFKTALGKALWFVKGSDEILIRVRLA